MSKFTNHLWKMPSKNLKQFRNKKSTKSCGYTWGKSASNFISLYVTAKLPLPFSLHCHSFNLIKR